jgi:hypothetical protein
LEETIILQEFLEHQEVANSSLSQEDPYLSFCKDLKLIAYSVQELRCSKMEVPNCDAVAAGHQFSRVLMNGPLIMSLFYNIFLLSMGISGLLP